MTKPLLPIGLREDSRAGGDTRISVFIGRNEGARERSGVITIRNDEWDDLQRWIEHQRATIGCLPTVEVMDPLNLAAGTFDIAKETRDD